MSIIAISNVEVVRLYSIINYLCSRRILGSANQHKVADVPATEGQCMIGVFQHSYKPWVFDAVYWTCLHLFKFADLFVEKLQTGTPETDQDTPAVKITQDINDRDQQQEEGEKTTVSN